MDRTTLVYSLIMFCSVTVGCISQVMLKKSALKKYDNPIREYLNPLVIIAYIFYVGTTILTITAYKGIPLSFGPIIESTSYIYITIFGVKIFGEKINKKKIIALCLIISGIIVYAFGR